MSESKSTVRAIYIKKATLEWPDIWGELSFKKDNGGRWYASDDTPESVREYVEGNFRSPSRAWPYSYAKPLLTQKFAKFLTENEPTIAIKCGVAKAV